MCMNYGNNCTSEDKNKANKGENDMKSNSKTLTFFSRVKLIYIYTRMYAYTRVNTNAHIQRIHSNG